MASVLTRRPRPLWAWYPESREGRWTRVYLLARAAAAVLAVAILLVNGLSTHELRLAVGGSAYALVSGFALSSERVRASALAWALDAAVVLVLIGLSGDWRSAYYPLFLTTLVMPATRQGFTRALLWGMGATIAFLIAALLGGPAPGRFGPISAETLSMHLLLPLVLTAGLAYAVLMVERLEREREQSERLAIETERRRIAWELHDSAKQRIHAARLVVGALASRAAPEQREAFEQAELELQAASDDMDTSLAELRSPLEGRPLAEALAERAAELASAAGIPIELEGRGVPLKPLEAAHAYRIASEALTNAARHSSASRIRVLLEPDRERLAVRVVDDGIGIPERTRPGSTGLLAMRSRAAAIGATLSIGPGAESGTEVLLELPLNGGGEERGRRLNGGDA